MTACTMLFPPGTQKLLIKKTSFSGELLELQGADGNLDGELQILDEGGGGFRAREVLRGAEWFKGHGS